MNNSWDIIRLHAFTCLFEAIPLGPASIASHMHMQSKLRYPMDITDTLVEVMDFVRAVVNLKLVDDDYHLQLKLYTKVLNVVAAVKDRKEFDQKHRLHELKKH